MGCELERDHSVICDLDLAGEIWADRPKLAGSAIYALPMEVTGESAKSKLERIRRAMAESQKDQWMGAQVLHPDSLLPVMNAGIPTALKNSFHPERPGTRIDTDAGANTTTR